MPEQLDVIQEYDRDLVPVFLIRFRIVFNIDFPDSDLEFRSHLFQEDFRFITEMAIGFGVDAEQN